MPAVNADLVEGLRHWIGPSLEGTPNWEHLLLQASGRIVARGGQARSWSRVVSALSEAVFGLEAAVQPAEQPREVEAAQQPHEVEAAQQPHEVEAAQQPHEVQQLTLPAISPQLAFELLMPQSWLQATLDLLIERRQLIFYGPPGTGKTFLARKLAHHVCADPADMRMIQFHPSYSYEDFVEGYQPRTAPDGALTYELVDGPLRELSRQAQDHPERPHVLLIDEINRGNMAKIFGELYFLLEYRDEPLRLQYSSHETFRLPPNILLIGTMSTADRSNALLDAGLRRRFSFVELTPIATPVEGLLERWLERHELDPEPGVLLDTLNSMLIEADGDPDLAIGPSYFLTRHGGSPDLEAIWGHDLCAAPRRALPRLRSQRQG